MWGIRARGSERIQKENKRKERLWQKEKRCAGAKGPTATREIKSRFASADIRDPTRRQSARCALAALGIVQRPRPGPTRNCKDIVGTTMAMGIHFRHILTFYSFHSFHSFYAFYAIGNVGMLPAVCDFR